MISFTPGTDAAIVRGGKYNNQLIYVDMNDTARQLTATDIMPQIMAFNVLPTQIDSLLTAVNLNVPPKQVKLKLAYDAIMTARNHALAAPPMREFSVSDSGMLEQVPLANTRQCIYVAGPSGSGKSTYVGKYAANYKKMFPKNNILLFSRVDKDEALDHLDPVRVTLDEENLIALEPADLEDSLCIFDDIDTLPNVIIREILVKLRDDVLETGRHHRVYCAITSHQVTNYKATRGILNESHTVTFFPKAGAVRNIEYMLKTYYGIKSKQIERIMSLPSRWITFSKCAPQYILYEKGIFML